MKKAVKKLIVLMMILTLALPRALVLAEETENTAGSMPAAVTITEAGRLISSIRVLQLGSSVYTIEIPDSFEEGERTDEDMKDDMVAYLHSPDTLLDFDIYQFSKEGYPEALADFAEQEAGEYNASEIVTDENINGIDAAWYRATENYDGQDYETVTYILDSGDEYVEIVFWMDGDCAQEEADQIMNSLTFVTR